MAYEEAADNAADRHFNDAVVLLDQKRFDNAGYHFGISAECAVKHLLVKRCGVSAGEPIIRKLHFPKLREAALQVVEGRKASHLIAGLLKHPGYTTHACNLRVRQASIGPRSARNNLLVLITHRGPKRRLAKCAGNRRAWYRRPPRIERDHGSRHARARC
jgi:hypothetical protein